MIENSSLRIVGELENTFGKAVQLYVRNVPILAVGDCQRFFHGKILEITLNEMGIPFERKEFLGDSFPAKQGDLYTVVGMGFATFLSGDKKQIRLDGDSTGYGLEIDKKHAKELNSHLGGFEIILDE